MPVTTASAAVHIAPVVLKTAVQHKKKRTVRKKEGKAAVPQDDIFFDQAFNIVKSFIELGTANTIESLQAFTNTRVPSPYWSAVVPVCVPLTTCNAAADILIDWFGPDELKNVVGGERWWQVRGLDGVEGEWIAEREHLYGGDEAAPKRAKVRRSEEEDMRRMEKLETVMLYVHGGGYFWGSINTHRFQILRYARKLHGRAFAVNYRKAPQYPWPCPIQDVLAAYLYLIKPPPGAPHSAIPPNKIVFAGDSAGGGLCLSTLTVLRDMGLPMPAGAVLISPWVDLTHSFPSVMQNTETDIIPEYGFLAKPSPLWPIGPSGQRVAPAQTDPPPVPGLTDSLEPEHGREVIEQEKGDDPQDEDPLESTQGTFEEDTFDVKPSPDVGGTPSTTNTSLSDEDGKARPDEPRMWTPKRPTKVRMNDPNAVPLEIHAQMQIYALSEQLTHPLVSPVLQGSLGNLPPLYILGGDGEVLKDEIVYLAHRAGHPELYPTRSGILSEWARQAENAEKFVKPTKVHLQVFDGMCHVLTVFMFTKSARYAYSSIAEFVNHVTKNDEAYLERAPFPSRPPYQIGEHKGETSHSGISTQYKRERDDGFARNDFGGAAPNEDEPTVSFVRERVDLQGTVRPMEEYFCLSVRPEDIGIIKEAPVMRWVTGQEKWDKKFSSRASLVVKKQKKYTECAERLVQNALEEGLVHDAFPQSLETPSHTESDSKKLKRKTSTGEIQADRRWGPLDLKDERPPPSAIAGRKDTGEAVALLEKCIYHTAPITHKTVPRHTKSDALRSGDDPNAPPKQSVSEQQTSTVTTMHGLRIWDKIVTYLGRKSVQKAPSDIKASQEPAPVQRRPIEPRIRIIITPASTES